MNEVVNQLALSFLTNPLVISIIILGFVVTIFQKQILGMIGEHWTRQALNKLPKGKYKIIHNVWIKIDGSTHQIDHVIVSPYGIFSVETKQYNGFITGSKYDKQWIRHAGKNKYYYTNPIRQNYGHVKALSQLLHIPKTKIYNVVCVPSNAKLKIKHDGELVRYDTIVDKILSYKEVVIDHVEDIVSILLKNNITDKNVKKEHIKNIRENIMDDDGNKCPKCGGELIERNGKYGKFIGCSNYPKCKYTK